METFIKLEKELLKRKDITSTQKLIISYLQSHQTNKLYWFAGEPKLSEELGLSLPTLKDNIKTLEKKKIIFKSEDKKHIQHRYNKRKAIVLVDKDNPYPTSNELSQQSNTNIPQEEIKPLKSNNNEIEKQVEMKAEELDKLLTERQNGDYSSTKEVIVDYETTLMGDISLIKIDDDLVVFYNEQVIEDTKWVYKYMKKKNEYTANKNLREKKERYEEYQRDLDKINNQN